MEDKFNLTRFVSAQNAVYQTVIDELKAGRKRTHWMWYIFPQLKHLGRSANAKFYGLSDADEAKAYLNHPILGQRLREVSETILSLSTDNAVEVFGGIDSRKLKSSMTLFDSVSPNDIFSKILEKYFQSRLDPLTQNLLAQTNDPN